MTGRGILGILLAITGLAVAFLGAYPMWGEINVLKTEKEQVSGILAMARNLSTKKNEIRAKYDAISMEDKASLEEFFPRKPDTPVWLLNISNLAAQSNLTFKGIEMSEGLINEDSQSASAQVSASGAENFEILPFSISVSGSYSALVSFLGSMERSKRLIEIDQIDFDSGEGKRDFFEFKISAHTFWKK